MTENYTDEWGSHSHKTLTFGSGGYDHRAPITCESCLKRLDAAADVWEAKFAARDGHNPDTFWVGYKRLWRQ